MTIMKATLVHRARQHLHDGAFVEIVIWRVPSPLQGSMHSFKYLMALVVDGACVMRFDNEAGKGDHKHVDGRETAYVFRGVDALFADFAAEVKGWFDGNSRSDD